MEDNIVNEHIENHSVQSVRKSSSRRIVTKSNSNIVTKHVSKVRQSKSEKYGADSAESEVVTTAEENLNYVHDVQDRVEQAARSRTSAAREERQDGEASATSAFHLYKAAGEWWNVFPKTDYTYSRFSACRKELAPGVWAMPNMSRPPLRSPSASITSIGSSMEAAKHGANYAQRYAHGYEADSVLRSNYILSSRSTESSTVSHKSTSVFTWVYCMFWRIITSTVSIVTSVFRRTHDVEFESSWSRSSKAATGDGGMASWLMMWYYKSACYFLLLDAWILSLFHRPGGRAASSVAPSSARRASYLLLLLLPLLLHGLLSAQGSSAPAAAVSTYAAWLQAMPSLWWGALRSLAPDWSAGGGNGGGPVAVGSVVEEGGGTAVGVEVGELVQRVLDSPQLQAALLRTSQQRGGPLEGDAARAEEALLEQRRLHDRLVLENSIMRSQLDELANEMTLLKASASVAGTASAPASAAAAAAAPSRCCRVRVGGCPAAAAPSEERVLELLLGLLGAAPSAATAANRTERVRAALAARGAGAEEVEARLQERLDERLRQGLREHSERVSKEWVAAATAAVAELVQQEVSRRAAGAGAGTAGAGATGVACGNCSLSADHVRKIVNSAISLYDADKTGLVDYALESAGGTVINIRCTESYDERSLALAFFGLTFPWSSNHPRIALQPDVHPGRCWAFRGAQGWLVVRLSKRIHVTAFSLEHIPAAISPAGNIDAAPKNFSIFGLDHESDMKPVLLGKYVYENPGPSLQYFPVQAENVPAYQIVELAIESNHGNLEYTCLYRFRVHGIAV